MSAIAEILRRIADDVEHNAEDRPGLVSVYSEQQEAGTEAVVVYLGRANREWLMDQLRRDG